MKMKHMAAAAVCGLMAMGGVFGASAAGIGYVNTSVLMQAHPKMEKAQLDMTAAAQKARAEFDSKAEGKSDAEKEKIANELEKSLAEKEKTTIGPIIEDIHKAIAAVREEKGLDIVIDQTLVIDGGVDITNEVGQKLQK